MLVVSLARDGQQHADGNDKPEGIDFFFLGSFGGVFGGIMAIFVLAFESDEGSFKIPTVPSCLGTQCMQVSPKPRNRAAERSSKHMHCTLGWNTLSRTLVPRVYQHSVRYT